MSHSTCDKATRVDGQRGSSSVMVIFLVIVLMVFAVLAFYAAYSNYQLSSKSQQWQQRYYALDAQGEAALYAIDEALLDAQAHAQYTDDFAAQYRTAVARTLPAALDAWNAVHPDAQLAYDAQTQIVTGVCREADGRMTLHLSLSVQTPVLQNGVRRADAPRYVITRWQIEQAPLGPSAPEAL